ncbi:MAG: protein phosphatase 2C domain-containing protein [Deltaproteobacteria bacterium]|nr:protein phosphatase 2C domain-containing protein [Deltaproteobacteria bacterium]
MDLFRKHMDLNGVVAGGEGESPGAGAGRARGRGPVAQVEVLWGGVAGRAHRLGRRGSQDACASVRCGDVVAAAVADGCSAGAHSAVGAGVGARIAAAAAARRAAAGTTWDSLPAQVLAELIAALAQLARAACVDDEDAAAFVAEGLLATMQVAVLRGDEACVFGVGDGVVLVDERLIVIEQGDAPDYPAYALFPAMAAPRLVVHHVGSLRAGVVLGSDGCRELLARADELLADGRPVGDLAAHLADPRTRPNPSLLHKRLFAWAEQRGAPSDDCTLVVLRRTP